ncbi:MAG: AAA family ATPase, partial [Rhabdochlamydiaceae bacterium]
SNGCGKSNLVDALLWGLGEGNTRQLRAATGIDVIFNGSSLRKPLSYSEVQITFDNEDGELPAPTSEVTISRKLNRGGESEFRINKTVCRLKDIHELLADSGLGRSGYAIVGQREIDAALSASPEERRGWVDEAAGVQRYRQRKVEAQRRLASAEQHLQRTRDILVELDLQREPLRDEAVIAKRYKEILGAMKSIELNLLRRDYLVAQLAMENADAKHQEAHKQIEDSKKAESSGIADITQLEAGISKTEAVIEGLRLEIQTANAASERNYGDQRLCDQRLNSLFEIFVELNELGTDSEEKLQRASEEANVAEIELKREETKLANLLEVAEDAGRSSHVARSKLQELDKAIGAIKNQESVRMRMLAEASHASQRLKEISRELSGIVLAENDLKIGIEESLKEFEICKSAVTEAENEQLAIKEQISQFSQELKNSDSQLKALLQEVASVTGRKLGIEAGIEAHEGLAQGPKAVLDAVKQGQLAGQYLPVGEAVQTDPEYALAIDTALGPSVNDLIVESEENAKVAIVWLKENRKGRATFQPIPLIREVSIKEDLRSLLKRRGVIGIASELVTCSKENRKVLDSLLNGILVVETLDDGLDIARLPNRPYSRIVTKDGEVIHSRGSVSG